ncbi:two-component regulator propeller domain-containing protein [Plebeiibacterium sediminum]|uniref:histidine kinase n=1 Tax=Plebeiibacterium sediminum TaxID=2992112 RepID=A0AAE3SGX4_9BACT|nr:two-component regulator propeller domain-containing protein [Plebeiobacterium sediminum]MCW3788938.1 response regulator [Plebeiobacterium sediminum]
MTGRYAFKLLSIILFVQTIGNISCFSYNLKNISRNQGLSNSAVTSICQDSDGYLWIGTCEGVNIYDGSEVKILNPYTSDNHFAGRIIENIIETEKGILWIQTNHALVRLNKYEGTTDVYPEFKEKNIYLKYNNKLCILKDNYLYYYTSATNNFQKIEISDQSSFKLLNAFIDQKNVLWQVRENGVKKYQLVYIKETDELEIKLIHESEYASRVIASDNQANHMFFVDADYDFYEVDLASDQKNLITNLQKELDIKGEISSIIKYHNNYLIGFKTHGVIQLIPQGENKFELHELDIYSGVFTMLVNRDQDNFWIATDGQGLFTCYNNEFLFNSFTFDKFPVQITKPIRALFVDEFKNLWIGTKGDGIYKIEDYSPNTVLSHSKTKNYNISNSNLPNNSVYVIKKGSRNLLWFGHDKGISYYSYTGEIKNLNNDHLFPSISYVFDIYQVNDSTLWLASVGNGIIKVNLDYSNNQPNIKDIKNIKVNNGKVSSNYFFSLCKKNDSTLLFGNRGEGAFSLNLNSEELSNINLNKEINKDVYSIKSDEKGNYWLGTGGGLVKYNGLQTQVYNQSHGLPNNTIHSIIDEYDNNIWLSSNKGIIKFDPEREISHAYNQNEMSDIIEYSDGACYLNLSDEYILFGGINGFVSIKSNNRYEIMNYQPEINVSELRINGEEQNIHEFIKLYQQNNVINLTYTQNFFSFKLSVIDYLKSNSYLYYYKLEGLNDSWINNRTSNLVSFSHIPPGNYVLKLKYKDLMTDSFSSIKSFNITIVPPWYKSKMAFLLYFIFCVGIIAFIFRYLQKIYQLKNKLVKVMLEENVKDEMYEAKMQLFTEITHDFFTPLTLILGPCENIISNTDSNDQIRQDAALIKNNAEKLHNLVREIIDTRKLELKNQKIQFEAIDLFELLSNNANLFLQISQYKHVDYQIDLQENITWNTNVNFIERILTNLISNAFKYVNNSGEVKVHMFKQGDDVNITISNTGKGIPHDKLDTIFEASSDPSKKNEDGIFESHGMGLSVCKHLVALINATIEVESTPNHWTHFTIKLQPVTSSNEMIPEVEEQTFEIKPSGETTDKQKLPVVVIVDDDPQLLSFISNIFVDIYNVVAFDHAQVAIEYTKIHHIDLIITDLMMPGINGISLIKEIRADKNLIHIPIVILSAKYTHEDKTEGISSGADAYISKPFSIEYIKSVVGRLLENKANLKNFYSSVVSNYVIENGNYVSNEDKEFFDSFLKVIEENISKPSLAINDISEIMGITTRMIYRKLEDITDKKPAEFIKEYRYKYVDTLLLTTNLTIEEIMDKCGVGSRATFFKNFAKIYGTTPKKYRQNAINHFNDKNS